MLTTKQSYRSPFRTVSTKSSSTRANCNRSSVRAAKLGLTLVSLRADRSRFLRALLGVYFANKHRFLLFCADTLCFLTYLCLPFRFLSLTRVSILNVSIINSRKFF